MCCEITCFLKTTAKKSGEPIHCLSLKLKVGDQSPPVLSFVTPMQGGLQIGGRTVTKLHYADNIHPIRHFGSRTKGAGGSPRPSQP